MEEDVRVFMIECGKFKVVILSFFLLLLCLLFEVSNPATFKFIFLEGKVGEVFLRRAAFPCNRSHIGTHAFCFNFFGFIWLSDFFVFI